MQRDQMKINWDEICNLNCNDEILINWWVLIQIELIRKKKVQMNNYQMETDQMSQKDILKDT